MRYNNPRSPGDQIKDIFMRGGIPVTTAIVALNILTFLVSFFSPLSLAPWVARKLAFSSPFILHTPWSFFTYPVVTLGFSLMMIISLVFFWITGGSLERSWGSQRFGVFFFILAGVSAAMLLLGEILRNHSPRILTDLFLPLTGLIVAFCMLNPTQRLSLYFIPFQIQARWIAALATAYVFFTYGGIYSDPVMGFFACGGILAAFLYVRYARSWANIGSYSAPPRGPDLRVYPAAKSRPKQRTALDGSPIRGPFDFAGRWKDRKERQRLERLLRNSGFTDREPDWHDDKKHRPR